MSRSTSITERQVRADMVRRELARHDVPPTLNELAERFPAWRARLDIAIRDLERAGVAAVELGRVRLLESAGKEGR